MSNLKMIERMIGREQVFDAFLNNYRAMVSAGHKRAEVVDVDWMRYNSGLSDLRDLRMKSMMTYNVNLTEDDLARLAEDVFRQNNERKLRQRHPQLDELYNQYQMMLALCE